MKRKVTDLLPNEAILISNDADLKVLEEFEKAGVIWYGSKHKPTEWNPIMADFTFPFVIVNTSKGLAQTCEVYKYRYYPATDFIGSEGDFDIPSNDSTIATFLRWQIEWYESNHDYQIATDTLRCWLDELEGKTEPTQLTRNTPTNSEKK